MRTWTKLIPAVVLVLPLTGSPLRADVESNTKDIEQLKKDVKDIHDEIARLRKDLIDNATQRSANAEQLRAIHALLERMVRQQETLRIQSGYNPASASPGAATNGVPATATITVQNMYSAPATVRINDQSFLVEAGQTRTIGGVPIGMFQYSVDVEGYGMIQAPRADTLRRPGYRISIFPRMPY